MNLWIGQTKYCLNIMNISWKYHEHVIWGGNMNNKKTSKKIKNLKEISPLGTHKCFIFIPAKPCLPPCSGPSPPWPPPWSHRRNQGRTPHDLVEVQLNTNTNPHEVPGKPGRSGSWPKSKLMSARSSCGNSMGCEVFRGRGGAGGTLVVREWGMSGGITSQLAFVSHEFLSTVLR